MKVWFVNNGIGFPCIDRERAMKLALEEAKEELEFLAENGGGRFTYSIKVDWDYVNVIRNTGYAVETFRVWECEVLE